MLLGTLVLGLVGLSRRRRRQDQTGRAAFRSARDSAFRELWPLLEDIYWKLRECNSDNSAVRALLREVNTTLGEDCVCFQAADLGLIGQYILALQRLRAAIYPRINNERAAVWESAGRPTPGEFVDIDVVTQEAVDLRNRVLQQMRLALLSD